MPVISMRLRRSIARIDDFAPLTDCEESSVVLAITASLTDIAIARNLIAHAKRGEFISPVIGGEPPQSVRMVGADRTVI